MATPNAIGRGDVSDGVHATGGNISAASNTEFTWPDVQNKDFPMAKVILFNDAASGADLLVKINGATAAAPTDFHFKLVPGATHVILAQLVANIQLYSVGAMTYKTDFTVVGWL